MKKKVKNPFFEKFFVKSISRNFSILDLELQNRIRSFNWISTEHLNCAIDEFSQEVRDLLYQAINGKKNQIVFEFLREITHFHFFFFQICLKLTEKWHHKIN